MGEQQQSPASEYRILSSHKSALNPRPNTDLIALYTMSSDFLQLLRPLEVTWQ